MFPILLDLKTAPIALAGNGGAALRRLRLLEADQASVVVYGPAAEAALIAAAGDRLVKRLPTAADIAEAQLLFIAGLPAGQAEELAAAARSAGVLVNTEDNTALSDFHVPAIVRRGDLTFTVSTGGASPALARILKRRIEAEFDEAWTARVPEIAQWRKVWRAEGLAASEITARTESALTERGWLS